MSVSFQYSVVESKCLSDLKKRSWLIESAPTSNKSGELKLSNMLNIVLHPVLVSSHIHVSGKSQRSRSSRCPCNGGSSVWVR